MDGTKGDKTDSSHVCCEKSPEKSDDLVIAHVVHGTCENLVGVTRETDWELKGLPGEYKTMLEHTQPAEERKIEGSTNTAEDVVTRNKEEQRNKRNSRKSIIIEGIKHGDSTFYVEGSNCSEKNFPKTKEYKT